MTSNPTARHYHNVASRRVNQTKHLEGIKRMVLERVEEEERNRVRPLEDPYLVGEEAASRARRERLARENGDEILYREDRRWDFFLGMFCPFLCSFVQLPLFNFQGLQSCYTPEYFD